MYSRVALWFLAGVLITSTSCDRGIAVEPNTLQTPRDWEELLARRLAALGHRNWIVVADSAYPAQSRAGIETIVTGANHLEVVQAVLDGIQMSKHVRAKILVDAELPHVSDKDAPGIDTYRAELKKLTSSHPTSSLPHEEVIARLDATSEKFSVLILKTDLALPYTSVFIELECGYWSADSEQRLRATIKSAEEP